MERDYHNRCMTFLRWCQLAQMPSQSNAQIDDALTAMMNEMFFEGSPGTDAKKYLAALGYWIPSLTRGSPELIKTQIIRRWMEEAFSGVLTPTNPLACGLSHPEPTHGDGTPYGCPGSSTHVRAVPATFGNSGPHVGLSRSSVTVSYTHLTLPTIYSV